MHVQTTNLIKLLILLLVSYIPAFTYGKPLVFSCETQFTRCHKFKDVQAKCEHPEVQRYVSELHANSIDNPNGHGYFGFSSCEVSKDRIACYDVEKNNAVGFDSISRSLWINRISGRLKASADFITDANSQRGFKDEYSGYCTRAGNLF